MKRPCWFRFFGVCGFALAGCGPDRKPPEPCDGPTFDLVVRAEGGELPADTRIKVIYGGNQEGEPYALGHPTTPQAVFCVEDTAAGGAGAGPDDSHAGGADGGDAGARAVEPADMSVQALRCRLYTQGPARVHVTASGYETIGDQPLSLDGDKGCEIEVTVVLQRQSLDGGM